MFHCFDWEENPNITLAIDPKILEMKFAHLIPYHSGFLALALLLLFVASIKSEKEKKKKKKNIY